MAIAVSVEQMRGGTVDGEADPVADAHGRAAIGFRDDLRPAPATRKHISAVAEPLDQLDFRIERARAGRGDADHFRPQPDQQLTL